MLRKYKFTPPTLETQQIPGLVNCNTDVRFVHFSSGINHAEQAAEGEAFKKCFEDAAKNCKTLDVYPYFLWQKLLSVLESTGMTGSKAAHDKPCSVCLSV